MNWVECEDCGREFYPPGSTRHTGPWQHVWEPDTYICPGCEGTAYCDEPGCYRQATTRRDPDGYVSGDYCDRCYEPE